jgi:hypothetical protein
MRLPCAAALTFVLLSPPVASAQEGGVQLSAGYSYGRTHIESLLPEEPAVSESLHGWTASLAFKAAGSLFVAAEATGHYGDLEGADLTRLALFAGPRFRFGSGSIRPFVHALAGVVRTSAGIEVLGVSISEGSSDFGGAAGAGVDFALGQGRWSLRLQGDYMGVRAEGGTLYDPRASAQAVYRLGGN